MSQAKGGAALSNPDYVALREFALGFPEAYEEFPWGHCAIKVQKKIFVTLGAEDGLSMSLKLTDSNFEALLLPFTEPTHYGMGKHGWVTSRLAATAKAPLGLLRAWIEESYRAVAPKKLVARLDEEGCPPARPARKRASTKKATAKKKTTKKATAKRKTQRKTATRKSER